MSSTSITASYIPTKSQTLGVRLLHFSTISHSQAYTQQTHCISHMTNLFKA